MHQFRPKDYLGMCGENTFFKLRKWTRKKCYSVKDSPTGIFRHSWLYKGLYTHTFISFPTGKFPPEPSRKHLCAKLHWILYTSFNRKKCFYTLKGRSSMRKHEKVALKMQWATHQSCVHKVQKSNTHTHVKPNWKCQEYKLHKSYCDISG